VSLALSKEVGFLQVSVSSKVSEFQFRWLSQTLGFVYLVCGTPIYTQNRGILLRISANMGVCPKTAHHVHKSAAVYTLHISVLIFLILA